MSGHSLTSRLKEVRSWPGRSSRLPPPRRFSGLQWIIDAYTLTFASFMLTGGALGDLFGRKRFFMAGLAVFLLGSLLCGLSGSIGQLIAFRALQGLGAALLLPGSLSIITATFRGEERGAAIGIWAVMSGLDVAIGPVIGGYLVEHVPWESIFFINVPIGVAGLALTWFVVRETQQAEAVVAAAKESFVHSLHVGMLVAVGFLVLASMVSFLFVRSHVEVLGTAEKTMGKR